MEFIISSVLNDPITEKYLAKLALRKRAFRRKQYVRIFLKLHEKKYERCRLAEAQNWKCCWCGIECTPDPDMRNSATIEHIEPAACGGSDDMDNKAMACNYCNQARGIASVEDFMEQIKSNNIQRKLNQGQNGISRRHKNVNRRPKNVNRRPKNVNRRAARAWKRADTFHKEGWARISLEDWIKSLKVMDFCKIQLFHMYGKEGY